MPSRAAALAPTTWLVVIGAVVGIAGAVLLDGPTWVSAAIGRPTTTLAEAVAAALDVA